MNELHLKYKINTGYKVSDEAERIKTDARYSLLADYVSWLEEQVELISHAGRV